MRLEIQDIPPCFINARGEWNCAHDLAYHARTGTGQAWEAPQGWTVQSGLPARKPDTNLCYRCNFCDNMLWEHELDDHALICIEPINQGETP